jgi:hypothetical protein
MDTTPYMSDKSMEKTKQIHAVFKQAGPKLLKCWDGWNRLLPPHVQAKHLNEFITVFMIAVKNAGCLEYVDQ